MPREDGLPLVCVVIPAYNEAAVAGDVVSRVRALHPWVVVIDDGSTDGTGAVCRANGATVVTHALNRGAGAALATGIEWAVAHGADILVTFDGDGQHRPEDIEALVAPVAAGEADVALGSRFLVPDERVPAGRRLTLKLAVAFTRAVARIRVSDTHNGLRAFSREAALRVRIRQDRMAHASEILNEIGRLGLRYTEVPVRVLYTDYSRRKGQPAWGALRILWDLIVG